MTATVTAMKPYGSLKAEPVSHVWKVLENGCLSDLCVLKRANSGAPSQFSIPDVINS